jgi:DNA invertase Pin-like site-specific DNA recombinase
MRLHHAVCYRKTAVDYLVPAHVFIIAATRKHVQSHRVPGLVNIVHVLKERGIGLKVLTGHRAAIGTTTASGQLVFGIFAALAEFEREFCV